MHRVGYLLLMLTLALPQGKVTLTLRPREAGSKIDQFRLLPLPHR